MIQVLDGQQKRKQKEQVKMLSPRTEKRNKIHLPILSCFFLAWTKEQRSPNHCNHIDN